jgi:hypothetical protein
MTPTPDLPASRTPWWRHLVNGAALVAILVVAGFVAHSSPNDELWQSPITVAGAPGERISGRNIAASVDEVRAADSVRTSNGWAGETSGVWVVVDVTVESVVDDYGAQLGFAHLVVGDTRYSTSRRPVTGTVAGASLTTGIPISGPLVFEVPRELLSEPAARDAHVQLALDNDPRVDSLIEVPVDLTALTIQPEIESVDPDWSTR